MRDSSTKEWPPSTVPSTGTRPPGLTRIAAPMPSSSAERETERPDHADAAIRLPDPEPEGRGGEGHETHAHCLRPREGVRVIVVMLMIGALTAGVVAPAAVLAERGSARPRHGLVGEG